MGTFKHQNNKKLQVFEWFILSCIFHKITCDILQFGRMILCEVGIGKTETVMKKEVTRQSPSTGFDSIIVSMKLRRDLSLYHYENP